MCGIVGYRGTKEALPILMESLKRLEYRGYDSAGIAVHDGAFLHIVKEAGRISVLESRLQNMSIKGNTGIAHTRWATHGEPNQVNAHPHTDTNGTVAIVHNGIIENYLSIKTWLAQKGISCVSDTDTEVVAHLAGVLWDGDMISTMAHITGMLKGSYALAMMHTDCPDSIAATRKDSPLIIGEGDDETFLASDVTAFLPYTRRCTFLDDNQFALLSPDGVKFFDQGLAPINLATSVIGWDAQAAEKSGYEHFMLKEMMEEPQVVRNTMLSRITPAPRFVTFSDLSLSDEQICSFKKIFITACGTAYHAGMIAKYLFEHLAGIPVEVEFASEFRYRRPLVDSSTLVLVISQSGETADTIAALREAKRLGSHVLGIVNTVGSTIAREADDVIYTWAGPEIAVASTKAYIAQLAVIHLLAVHVALRVGRMGTEEAAAYLDELQKIPNKIEMILAQRENIHQIAKRFAHGTDIFFIGRGFDYNIALEGSLKLKEISYIHSEAYAAGELKHGTIALIEEGTCVAALCTQSQMIDKMISNIKEVKARGAVVFAITCEHSKEIMQVADTTLFLPDTPDNLVPILAIVPLQLFAYYCAVERGCDVDKPRNLAKSVTVE